MSRPFKHGLDYFNISTDFFHDIKVRKLVRAQGGKAVAVYLSLLCNICKSGYYAGWDEDLPFIISEETGLEEVYIREVIKYCLSIDLLSADIYEREGVLTSREIQETYRLVSRRRSSSVLKYSLLDDENRVIADNNRVIVYNNGVNVDNNRVIVDNNPISKVKKSKYPPNSPNGEYPPLPGETAPKASRKKFVKPTVEEVEAYCLERGNAVDARTFWDFYESKGWMIGRNPMKDWRAAVRTWERDRGGGGAGGRPARDRGGGPVVAPVAAALEENERTMRRLMEKARAELGDDELKQLTRT